MRHVYTSDDDDPLPFLTYSEKTRTGFISIINNRGEEELLGLDCSLFAR